jgi:hypothetical protein
MGVSRMNKTDKYVFRGQNTSGWVAKWENNCLEFDRLQFSIEEVEEILEWAKSKRPKYRITKLFYEKPISVATEHVGEDLDVTEIEEVYI